MEGLEDHVPLLDYVAILSHVHENHMPVFALCHLETKLKFYNTSFADFKTLSSQPARDDLKVVQSFRVP